MHSLSLCLCRSLSSPSFCRSLFSLSLPRSLPPSLPPSLPLFLAEQSTMSASESDGAAEGLIRHRFKKTRIDSDRLDPSQDATFPHLRTVAQGSKRSGCRAHWRTRSRARRARPSPRPLAPVIHLKAHLQVHARTCAACTFCLCLCRSLFSLSFCRSLFSLSLPLSLPPSLPPSLCSSLSLSLPVSPIPSSSSLHPALPPSLFHFLSPQPLSFPLSPFGTRANSRARCRLPSPAERQRA